MAKRRFDWAAVRQPSTPAAAGAESAAGDASEAVPLDSPTPDAASALTSTPIGRGNDPPGQPPPDAVAIRVNDLKQFAYCPRIVFYQYTMPVERRATFKMEHGKSVEPRVEQLEQRRKLKEYGLAHGTRRFQVPMLSRRLGLSGRVDLLIETADGMFPVDFKDTTAPIRDNHRVQLCAYALLIEDTFGRPVRAGFIYRVPREDVTAVEMSATLRRDTLRAMQGIRTLIRAEQMPEATTVRARCADCEYRNYCGDVF